MSLIHVPAIPLIPGSWYENWIPGTIGVNEPDRWTATKKFWSGVVLHEVGFSNASFTPGSQADATFGCQVQVAPPRGYEIVADCERSLPDVWYPMREAMRRYALYPKAKPELRAEAERLAAGVYDVTKWRRGRLFYGPLNAPFPILSSAQLASEAFKVSSQLAQLRGHLINGTSGGVEKLPDGSWDQEEGPVLPKISGWRTWGPIERGRQAGSGIFPWTGYEQAPDGPAFAWLEACCSNERRWHAFHRASGAPITVYDYPDPGPMYQEGSQTANNRWLPEFQNVCPWPDPLALPYDASHSIRGFRHLVFLSEATDSPAVRRMLRSQAAQFRLQYSDRGPPPQASGYKPPCLRTWLHWMQGNPGQGFLGQDTGRMIGWPAYLIAQSIKRAGASENKPWAEMLVDFVEAGVMPNGILSRCHENNPADVWYDAMNDTAHSFEVPMLWGGGVGCANVTGKVFSNPTRFAEVLYEEAPLYPYYSGHGPPQYAFVAKRDGAPYSTVTDGKNAWQPNSGDSTFAHVGCTIAAILNPNERGRWVDNAKSIENFYDLRKSAGILAQEQLL